MDFCSIIFYAGGWEMLRCRENAEDNKSFTTEYLDIDGEAQDMLTTGIILDSIFSSYEESHGM